MNDFSGRGNDVELGDVVVRGRGIAGRAEVHVSRARGVRALIPTGTFDELLADTGMREQYAVELRDLSVEAVQAAPPGRRAAQAEEVDRAHVEIEVPAPAGEWGQVVLAEDEDGVFTWHFGMDAPGASTTRGRAARTYRIGIRGHPPEETGGKRGLLGTVVRKVVKVLAFKAAAEAGTRLVSFWESRNRAHRLLDLGTAERADDAAVVPADRWTSLSGGPLLLLVHGTNSRCATAFASLPEKDWALLADRYDKRVVGFDHPTLSVDPAANVEWLTAALARDLPGPVEVDVLCHSRGGLVARLLAETEHRGVTVRRIVFVATPNAGTALADANHLNTFVDAYTNLLTLTPDTPATVAFEGIVAIVQGIALGILGELPGLQSMVPGGEFLSALNQGPAGAAHYSALAADFEPAHQGLRLWAQDHLLDRVFGGDTNDLVVPTRGVFASNPSGYFPIEDRREFAAPDGIHHSGFFGNPDVLGFVQTRLTG